MNPSEIYVELSIKLLELEKALDSGMPYPELKKIYSKIKELQYQFALSAIRNDAIASESNDLVIE